MSLFRLGLLGKALNRFVIVVGHRAIGDHRRHQSSVPNTKPGERASSERRVIAVPDREGVDCSLLTPLTIRPLN
jgi:hypothetical protein